MYNFFTEAHGGWHYLTSMAMVAATTIMVITWLSGRTWRKLEQRAGTIAVVLVDIQLLLGLILWGVGANMGIVGANRERTIEHPIVMLLAIAILHIGWIWTRRADGSVRPRTGALTFIVSGLLVLAGLTRAGVFS